MDNRERELQSLAEEVFDSLKSLPQDGLERQITIRLGGDNSGAIHVGPTVHINPAQPRPLELHEMDSKKLSDIKRTLTSNRNNARLRCYLNFPFFLSLLLWLFAGLFAVWNFYLVYTGNESPSVLKEKSLLIYAIWAGTFILATRAMSKIRKVESRIINENQCTIDSIDVILRRRKF